jgi:hypothetical protein
MMDSRQTKGVAAVVGVAPVWARRWHAGSRATTHQHPSAWTQELDVRPFKETF